MQTLRGMLAICFGVLIGFAILTHDEWRNYFAPTQEMVFCESSEQVEYFLEFRDKGFTETEAAIFVNELFDTPGIIGGCHILVARYEIGDIVTTKDTSVYGSLDIWSIRILEFQDHYTGDFYTARMFSQPQYTAADFLRPISVTYEPPVFEVVPPTNNERSAKRREQSA